MTHTALVLGGQGVLGTFIARELRAAGWKVTRAGRRPEDAPDFRLVDLDDPAQLSQACVAADVVVNTVPHEGLAPERTVLRDGGTLINLGELTQSNRARLASEGAEGRGLVVADTGFSGVAYLALAELLGEHPEADAAEYALMFSAQGSTGRTGAVFAHGLLTAASRHATTMVPFPAPFGERRCLEVGAEGDGVLRTKVGELPVRHYLCMQPRALHGMLLALSGARLMRFLPRASFTAGTRKVPAELSEEPICEWVGVSRGGKRIASQTLWGRGYYRMTAAATLAFAEALVAHGSNSGQRGIRSIDELVSLGDVRPRLEQCGIAVRREAPASPVGVA